ncbi:MAG: hypothetical protein JWN85_4686 [Gammaproteobacteria bacterium]|nr:hypothetical protein [Gammaproteobacteria bacterium]
MSSLPRVGGLTRERIAREFDDRGPEVCRTEITLDLEANNPELLDMASRCARDVGDFTRIMTGFCMFYRLLTAEARAALGPSANRGDRQQLSLLPRVAPATRADIVKRIDSIGSQEFTREAITELERNNPELLLMAHHFAEDQADYGGVIQGFALLYASLLAQAAQERGILH